MSTYQEHAISMLADQEKTMLSMREPHKLTTKHGLHTFDKPMSYSQAVTWGERNMPKELRRAGFQVRIYCACMDINGWIGYRINYGK